MFVSQATLKNKIKKMELNLKKSDMEAQTTFSSIALKLFYLLFITSYFIQLILKAMFLFNTVSIIQYIHNICKNIPRKFIKISYKSMCT